MDLIRNDNETPGLTLFAIMKERHVISTHNVMSLKEALEELQLIDISETLVIPYQRKIDRLRFEQWYLSLQ
ncbi:hypothetical protein HOLleu_21433 [Holothuria leucospilota]|uniref:Uncharacterized protein n=1 Tax=Holothuria leucospilota TaxID=206669 RepID=A0A9Q1BXA5_HOLLE|nr:hypothetical protein HOLleu_21433 [Holothuria leucospilota]